MYLRCIIFILEIRFFCLWDSSTKKKSKAAVTRRKKYVDIRVNVTRNPQEGNLRKHPDISCTLQGSSILRPESYQDPEDEFLSDDLEHFTIQKKPIPSKLHISISEQSDGNEDEIQYDTHKVVNKKVLK